MKVISIFPTEKLSSTSHSHALPVFSYFVLVFSEITSLNPSPELQGTGTGCGKCIGCWFVAFLIWFLEVTASEADAAWAMAIWPYSTGQDRPRSWALGTLKGIQLFSPINCLCLQFTRLYNYHWPTNLWLYRAPVTPLVPHQYKEQLVRPSSLSLEHISDTLPSPWPLPKQPEKYGKQDKPR